MEGGQRDAASLAMKMEEGDRSQRNGWFLKAGKDG
jgi:hypothetical protein